MRISGCAGGRTGPHKERYANRETALIRSIRGHGQGASSRHRFYSEIRRRSKYISTTMYAIVSAWRRISAIS